MATITGNSGVYNSGGTNIYITTWTPLAGADIGDAVEKFGAADRSVQIFGAFDGATMTWQGSNDGSTFATLHDPQGADLAFTAAGILAVSEVTRYMRPSVSGGGGSCALTVILSSKLMS